MRQSRSEWDRLSVGVGRGRAKILIGPVSVSPMGGRPSAVLGYSDQQKCFPKKKAKIVAGGPGSLLRAGVGRAGRRRLCSIPLALACWGQQRRTKGSLEGAQPFCILRSDPGKLCLPDG